MKYRIKGNNTCWSVTDKITDFPHSRLVHYNGCVNIGMESELLLRVENPLEGLRYHWQIPETWEPIGDTNGSELRVITHETKDTTRIYGVKFADFGPSLFDTVQVRGADITLYILDDFDCYWPITEDTFVHDEDTFEYLWYKGRLHPDSVISGYNLEPKYSFYGNPPILAYRSNSSCWSVTDEVVVFDSIYPIKLVHYDGCVNIGVPDTLLLRVENADARMHYRWKIPAEWESIGDTNHGELRVITHETKDTTRVYGVRFADGGDEWIFDTVQVKGADTTLLIMLRHGRYNPINKDYRDIEFTHFDFAWYKGNLTEENWIVNNSSWILKSQCDGQKPLLKYRIKGNNTCWFVTDEVVVHDSVVPIKIKHYDGCVNIGVPDTLLLQVENADERLRYHWQIPETWEPIGDTNRGELRVITHETKDTTHIYGVKFADRENLRYDTVQVKGADTKLLIFDLSGLDMYSPMGEDFDWIEDDAFTYAWYKTALSPDNFVDSFEMVAKYRFKGEPPILARRLQYAKSSFILSNCSFARSS